MLFIHQSPALAKSSSKLLQPLSIELTSFNAAENTRHHLGQAQYLVWKQPAWSTDTALRPKRYSPGLIKGLKLGDNVMCLLSGGGYAEQAVVPASHCLLLPDHMSLVEASSIPEAWLTAFQLLAFVARVKYGGDSSASGKCEKSGVMGMAALPFEAQSVLIHAGASGVGTAAIQLARHVFGIQNVFAIVGNEEKRDLVEQLGATGILRNAEPDFSKPILEATSGRGVDVVLDCVGGTAAAQNTASIAAEGRWVLFGLLGGPNVQGPELLSTILRKRIMITGTTLRGRSPEYKTLLISEFRDNVLPLFANRTLRPIIDATFPLSQVGDAHSYVEANKNRGKVILKVADLEHEHTEM